LLILLAVSLASLQGAARSEESVRRVVDRIQPAVLAVTDLETRVQRAAAAMGFYLKSREDGHKAQYLAETQALVGALEQVAVALQDLGDESLITRFAVLADRVGAFAGYQTRLLELTSATVNNMPALALAENQLNPRHMEILQALQEMLASERDAQEEALAEISNALPVPSADLGVVDTGMDRGALTRLQGRVEVLVAIQDARYTWGQVITGTRGFLAFREDALRQNNLIYLEQNEVAMKRLEAAAAEERLTFEQTDALERLLQARAAYVGALHRVFELHGGEQAYTDVYLVRTEIGPLMDSLSRQSHDLVIALREQIDTQSAALAARAEATRGLVWALLLGGLTLGLVVSVVMSRNIRRKLHAAVAAMEETASGDGDLTRELRLQGSDEMARLAAAFNAFLAKIRHTIGEVSQTACRT